jgi:three-Cys-motif partner protein
MLVQHQFGGSWTERKLDRVRKYLSAYMTIFTKNSKAATLRTMYVDAFAGTGYRIASSRSQKLTSLPLFDDKDAESFQKGSAHIALETEPPFDQYFFIDHVTEHIQELEKLRERFPHRAQSISIIREEANDFLRNWCRTTNWHSSRAVVFLDPYGMEVE